MLNIFFDILYEIMATTKKCVYCSGIKAINLYIRRGRTYKSCNSCSKKLIARRTELRKQKPEERVDLRCRLRVKTTKPLYIRRAKKPVRDINYVVEWFGPSTENTDIHLDYHEYIEKYGLMNLINLHEREEIENNKIGVELTPA